MSIAVLHRTRLRGRHRLGDPGLIPVTALVAVLRRGRLRSWLRPGRHRRPLEKDRRIPALAGAVPAAG